MLMYLLAVLWYSGERHQYYRAPLQQRYATKTAGATRAMYAEMLATLRSAGREGQGLSMGLYRRGSRNVLDAFIRVVTLAS